MCACVHYSLVEKVKIKRDGANNGRIWPNNPSIPNIPNLYPSIWRINAGGEIKNGIPSLIGDSCFVVTTDPRAPMFPIFAVKNPHFPSHSELVKETKQDRLRRSYLEGLEEELKLANRISNAPTLTSSYEKALGNNNNLQDAPGNQPKHQEPQPVPAQNKPRAYPQNEDNNNNNQKPPPSQPANEQILQQQQQQQQQFNSLTKRYEEQISDYQRQISKLTEDLNDCNNKLQLADEDNEMNKQLKKTYQDRLIENRVEIKSLQDENQRLQDKLSNIDGNNNLEKNELNTKIKSLQNQLTDELNEINSLKNKNNQLLDQIKKLQEPGQDISESVTRIKDLEFKLAQSNKNLDVIYSKLAESDSETHRLKMKNSELEKKIEELILEIESFRNSNSNTQEINSLKTQNSSLVDENSALKKRIELLTTNIMDIQSNRSAQESQQNYSSSQIASLQNEIHSLKQQNVQLVQEKNQIQSTLQNKTNEISINDKYFKESQSQSQEENFRLRKQLDEIKLQLQNEKQKNSDLGNEREQLLLLIKNKDKEISSQNDSAHLRQQLKSFELQLKQQEDENVKASQLIQDTKNLQQKILQLQENVKKSEIEKSELSAEISQKNLKISNLENQLQNISLNDNETKISLLTSELETYKDTVYDLKNTVFSCQKKGQDAIHELNEQLQQERNNSIGVKCQYDSKISFLEVSVDGLQAKNNVLSEEVANLNEQIVQKDNEIKKLQNSLKFPVATGNSDECAQLKKRIAELEQQIENLSKTPQRLDSPLRDRPLGASRRAPSRSHLRERKVSEKKSTESKMIYFF